jgi:hypothetical protein
VGIREGNSGASVDRWKEMIVGYRKPKAYTCIKNAGPQFNLLPDVESMDCFALIFNGELLNNVIETNRYS